MKVSDTMTLEIRRAAGGSGRDMLLTAHVAEAVLQDNYGPAILEAFSHGVVDALVKQWLDQHAAEVLEQLGPGVIAEGIRSQIAQKVLAILTEPKR